MVAQRHSPIVVPEKATALQFRHDEIDELGKGSREY
jgi:hypothetical protein